MNQQFAKNAFEIMLAKIEPTWGERPTGERMFGASQMREAFLQGYAFSTPPIPASRPQYDFQQVMAMLEQINKAMVTFQVKASEKLEWFTDWADETATELMRINKLLKPQDAPEPQMMAVDMAAGPDEQVNWVSMRQQDYDAMRSDLAKYRAEVPALDAEISRLKQEAERQHTLHDNLNRQHEGALARAQQAYEEVAQLRDDAARMEQMHKNQAAIIREQHGRLDSRAKEIAELEARCADYQGRADAMITKLSMDKVALLSHLLAQTRENVRLQKQIENAKAMWS